MTTRWIVHLILALAAVASLAFTGDDGASASLEVGSHFRDGIGVGACADARVMWIDPDRVCVYVRIPPG